MKYTLFLISSFLFITMNLLAQPSNDDCLGAIDLGIIPNCETTIYSNVNASASNIGINNIPTCFNGGNVNNDVWFSFQIPTDGSIENFEITISATETGGIKNPQIAIYRGDCSTDQLSELGVCASAEQGENSLIVEAIGLKRNTQYFLRINDYSATATPNWGDFTLCIEELAPFFNMGETEGTGLCSGTLYDSGGRNGDYSTNENLSFSICPTDFHRCIEIVVEEYDTETDFDDINIFAGSGNDLSLLSTINGEGKFSLAFTDNDCVTINFTSDASQNDVGFKLTWECSVAECPIFEEKTCADPHLINSIPFQANDLTTCFAGNSVETGACGNDEFLDGEEYIFAYDSPGGECLSLAVTGVNPFTGVTVLRGCPESGDAVCVNQKGGNDDRENLTISNITLKERGRYYFIIAQGSNCTPFSIAIDNSTTCPNVFPSASDCSKALILNGCDSDLPSALRVEPGEGSPDFFQFGVNNGCWEDVLETNYTWFTFEAQQDGEFAFLLRNNEPTEVVDIDFNIWGPFASIEESCNGSNTLQPVRSSWADDLLYSITGLTNTNPVLGTPVTSTCQGSVSDGFVKPLAVKKGETYVVLINDFDGVIFSGAISVDFSETTAGVLGSVPNSLQVSQDTFICLGESIQLAAEGASLYEWESSESLSCINCPNPIATPIETTTYLLNATTVCNTIQREVTVEVIRADIGNDQTVCQGAIIQLDGNIDSDKVTYEWSSPNGLENLSCIDCPNPIITTMEGGIFEYILTLKTANCVAQDTMSLTILEGTAPTYTIADDQELCIGASIEIGGERVEGQTYSWTTNNSNFSSTDANPPITPMETTTYYLAVSNEECQATTKDSVLIKVNEKPIIDVIEGMTVCQGNSIILGNTLAEPMVNYEWTSAEIATLDNPMIANPTATPVKNSFYTLTATNGACLTSKTVSVNITPIEVDFQIADRLLEVCLGESITLNPRIIPANAVPTIITLNGDLDTNTTALTVQPIDNQVYVATVVANGCTLMDTLVVKVDSLPTNMAIMPADTTICLGTQLVMTSPIYDPQFFPNIEHVWQPDVGFDSPDSFYNLVITPSDTVTLMRINRNGACEDTSIAVINVLPFIEIPIAPDPAEICPGESMELVAEIPEGAEDLEWSPMETINCADCPNPTVTPIQTTTYTLSGTLMDCPLMGEKEVVVYATPVLTITGETNLFVGNELDLALNSELDNIESIQWLEEGNFINGAMDSNLVYIPLANEPISDAIRTAVIEARITTLDGCVFSTTVTVVINPPTVPTAFTPEDPIANNHFNLLMGNTENTVQIFKVYNRWGKVVYDNDSPAMGWNGRLRNSGELQPAAVYLYQIQYKVGDNLQLVKGDVTLVR